MNLVTPDAGLLFWMTVIFGVVLLLLWKFGFPIITDSLDKRNRRIEQSLRDAREIQDRMEQWTKDHARMLEETRVQQAEILRKASETGN
ncbi:MAG: ATP synthase F0 subunit B, partial [Bacteroidales bacterium]|nr:ATP synthase F0 subunit B [Bacteroidales bacterium]